ncbi:MAG: flippase [Candidatus Aenigmarchaeota archaeon]|nr:flippase [Candidatus Aenigmarchaeota archaeon]
MNYAERIIKGSFWIFTMYFIGGFFSTLLRVYLARNLSVEDFGLLYAVLSAVGFLVVFKDIGFSSAMTRFIAQFRAKNDSESIKSVIYSVIAMQLFLALIFSSVFFVLSPYLASAFFKSAKAETIIFPILVSFIFGVFVSLQYVLQGLGKIELYSLVEPFRNIITLAFAVVLLPMGLLGVSYSYLFSTIALTIILFLMILKSFPFFSVKGHFDRKLTKEIVDFGKPLFFSNIGGVFLGYADTIMITAFLSVSDVGLYQVALPTSQILWVLLGSVSIVILPIVSELWAKGDAATISRILSLMLKFSFIVAIPFVITIVAFPEVIITMLFGSKYAGASTALQILAINSIFYTVFSVTSISIIGIGKTRENMRIVLTLSAANILINLLLIPSVGITGAAVATLVSYFIGTVLAVSYLKKMSLVDVYAHDIVKAFFCGAAAFAAITFTKHLVSADPWHEAVIALFLGSVVYLASLYLTKTVKKDELLILKKSGIPVPEFLLKLF